MSPHFEQYTGALARAIKGAQKREEVIIASAQAQITQLQGRISQGETTIEGLSRSLEVVQETPPIDIFIAGPEHGPAALTDFAHQALRDRLTANNSVSQQTAENNLDTVLKVNQALAEAGIDTGRRISLDPDKEAPILVFMADNQGTGRNQNEIVFNGQVVTLTPNELAVYRYLQEHEGIKVKYRDIAEALGRDNNVVWVANIMSSLRKKLEQDRSNPQFFVGTKGRPERSGITYYSPDSLQNAPPSDPESESY